MYSSFRWFVVLTMFIVTASTSLVMIAPITVVESIVGSSGMDPSTVMTITMSVFNLFIVIAVLSSGPLVDKFGVNNIYIGCLVVVILGNLIALFFGNSAVGLFFARALQGLGTGPIMASIALLARQWFKPQEQGVVTGLQGMAVSVGIALGFVLVPHLTDTAADWGDIFEVISLINLIGILLTLVVIFGPKPAISAAEGPGAEDAVPKAFKLITPLVLIGAFCFFGGTWLQQSVNTIGSGFIGSELGMGQVVAGDLMFYYSIAFAIGSPISGLIAGMWLKGRKDHLVIALSFLISAVFSVWMLGVDSRLSIVATLVVLGFFQSFINPIVMSFIARNYPVHVIGKVAGFSMTFSFVAGILSPIACSLIFNATGTYSASFISIAAVSVLGVLISWNLKAKYLKA